MANSCPTDRDAHLVVLESQLRQVLEREVAEVRVSIEAAEILCEQLHQDLVRARAVSGLVVLAGLDDGIRVEVVGMPSRLYRQCRGTIAAIAGRVLSRASAHGKGRIPVGHRHLRKLAELLRTRGGRLRFGRLAFILLGPFLSTP